MGYRVAAGMACFGLLPHGSGFWLDSRVASAPACLVHRRSTPCRSRRCMAVECNGLWVGSVRTLLWVAGWGAALLWVLRCSAHVLYWCQYPVREAPHHTSCLRHVVIRLAE